MRISLMNEILTDTTLLGKSWRQIIGNECTLHSHTHTHTHTHTHIYIYLYMRIYIYIYIYKHIYLYIYIYIYIIIITIKSRRRHRYPWPSFATSPYRSSPLAGLQGHIPYPHIAAGCMFVLVILLLPGHMWGSIGVHLLLARPCFSSSDLHVWFV